MDHCCYKKWGGSLIVTSGVGWIINVSRGEGAQ